MDPIEFHIKTKGKIEIKSRVPIKEKDILKVAYTPGVAEPCVRIGKDDSLVNIFTRRWNNVAIVSDGSAILGLGNLGGKAAMPVMEGKAVLFKAFGGVDAFPICVNTQDVSDIISIVAALEPTFGGINLEDIAAPKCFEIERELKKRLDIPVFHDDQHGTAVVVLAGLINACELTRVSLPGLKVIINGAGAAGLAITRLLLRQGVEDIVVCDSKGILSEKRPDLTEDKLEIARITNRALLQGGLEKAVEGRNVFIGVSAPGVLKAEMVGKMAGDPMIFAMANPVPEIYPDEAFAAGAAIVATGRSDFPNQINNVLAFPGIFRGALDVEAADINEDMKAAASLALAKLAQSDGLRRDYIIPDATDMRVGPIVAGHVAEAAVKSGLAKKPGDKQSVIDAATQMLKEIQ